MDELVAPANKERNRYAKDKTTSVLTDIHIPVRHK